MDNIPVKGKEGWFRAASSGAIQCGDTSKYEKFMKGYRAELEKEKQNEALQTTVSGLQSDMSEIKALLLTLAEKKS